MLKDLKKNMNIMEKELEDIKKEPNGMFRADNAVSENRISLEGLYRKWRRDHWTYRHSSVNHIKQNTVLWDKVKQSKMRLIEVPEGGNRRKRKEWENNWRNSGQNLFRTWWNYKPTAPRRSMKLKQGKQKENHTEAHHDEIAEKQGYRVKLKSQRKKDTLNSEE